MDTSISKSTQLDFAVPASKIAGLSSGEFVGMVADDPDQKIKLISFHCEILQDYTALAKERAAEHPLPPVQEVAEQAIFSNYFAIKKEIQELIETELETLLNTVE